MYFIMYLIDKQLRYRCIFFRKIKKVLKKVIFNEQLLISFHA